MVCTIVVICSTIILAAVAVTLLLLRHRRVLRLMMMVVVEDNLKTFVTLQNDRLKLRQRCAAILKRILVVLSGRNVSILILFMSISRVAYKLVIGGMKDTIICIFDLNMLYMALFYIMIPQVIMHMESTNYDPNTRHYT